MTKIGIIREGKTPADKRVPLTPMHCKKLKQQYSDVSVVVQASKIRAIPDQAYRDAGIEVSADVSDCDILIGVKEVPEAELIPNKTYLFFSHTFKEQPYNRSLLQTILKKKISLIDYEVLTDSKGRRLIGFGRYAGIVGCYNGLRAAGIKWDLYDLKPAHLCEDKVEVERELKKVSLPSNFKIVLTGKGRVSSGALEILTKAGIKKVASEKYLNKNFEQPVFAQLSVAEYNKTPNGGQVVKKEFYEHPERFVSNFMPYARVSDVYIPCHYWDASAPFIFTRQDAKSPDFKIRVVADISCDIDGPVASTLRPSTIAHPLYGYDPQSESEVGFLEPNAIGVMAVDNLPCELPKDASTDFGDELLENVMPELLQKTHSAVIARARQTDLNGNLTDNFSYLQDYVDGKFSG